MFLYAYFNYNSIYIYNIEFTIFYFYTIYNNTLLIINYYHILYKIYDICITECILCNII